MTACVGNYFRLAFLLLLRKITECGNYSTGSPAPEHALLFAGAHPGAAVAMSVSG